MNYRDGCSIQPGSEPSFSENRNLPVGSDVPQFRVPRPVSSDALASFAVSPSSVINKDYRDGYIQQLSLGIQKSLPRWDLVIQPAYVGSKGTKIIEFRQINQPRGLPGPIQARKTVPNTAR